MSNKVIVHKNRTNTLLVNMGINVVGSVITSEIRSEPSVDSPLIAQWVVSYVTDGTDGKLKLVLDNTFTADIKANSGYMDMKRVVGGEPLAVFDEPLEVAFIGTVTQ